MFRLSRKIRARACAVAAAVVASIALTFAAAGPAAAANACTGNSQLYAPSAGFPDYRVHTSSHACYGFLKRNGWTLYGIHNWRCGEFNCHSFWLSKRA